MFEVRFLGRGGQGAVLAAELLAEAAFREGKFPQSFPFFGLERRGAPVTAYARISDLPIHERGSVATPDALVVLDRGLLWTPGATDGLRPGGWVLVNAPPEVEAFPVPAHARLASVDASRIASEHRLGSLMVPIVNTAVLGALAGLTGVVRVEAVEQAIESRVPGSVAANQAACREGAVRTVLHDDRATRLAPLTQPVRARAGLPDGPIASRSSEEVRTRSWRTLKPEIRLDRCTRCNFCWKYCPDVAIDLNADGYPVVVLDHCKGCGICAEVCPPRTISMVPERGELVA